ncbi:MAG: response regulator [Burkholderiales bacterium]|nr:response regulator [Burkholderiales bacterium]
MEEARKKILVVDDDPAVLKILETKLASRYYVVTTGNPAGALALARREKPDAVLCDIDMPDMTGGDVAAALAGDPATAFIPFVYLTNLVSPEEARDLGGQVGGRSGISKRAPLAELVKVIDEALK